MRRTARGPGAAGRSWPVRDAIPWGAGPRPVATGRERRLECRRRRPIEGHRWSAAKADAVAAGRRRSTPSAGRARPIDGGRSTPRGRSGRAVRRLAQSGGWSALGEACLRRTGRPSAAAARRRARLVVAGRRRASVEPGCSVACDGRRPVSSWRGFPCPRRLVRPSAAVDRRRARPAAGRSTPSVGRAGPFGGPRWAAAGQPLAGLSVSPADGAPTADVRRWAPDGGRRTVGGQPSPALSAS